MKHNINQHFSNAKKTHPWIKKGGKNQNIETELKGKLMVKNYLENNNK